MYDSLLDDSDADSLSETQVPAGKSVVADDKLFAVSSPRECHLPLMGQDLRDDFRNN
jgi:hypothetical protein